MKNLHTPGPWRVRQDNKTIQVSQCGPFAKKICNILNGGLNAAENITLTEATQNARLIATAPDNTSDNLRAYAYLLRFMPMEHRATVEGQFMLSSMRASIGNAYGLDGLEAEALAANQPNEFKPICKANGE